MKDRTADKVTKYPGRLTILIVLVSAVLIVALIVPMAKGYSKATGARLVLLQAKTVGLAVRNVTASCYGQNIVMADPTDEYGFAEGIREEIEELSACAGHIYLLQWDEVHFRVKHFAYAEGDYLVTYKQADDGSWSWECFYLDPAP